MDAHVDVLVIGAGLAGLVVANRLADRGRSVAVVEKRSGPGGRARTTELGDHLVNQGPHALFLEGEAIDGLRTLGIEPTGTPPPTRGSMALHGGRLHLLPSGPTSLLRTGLLSVRAKVEAGRLLAGLPRTDPGPLDGVRVSDWLDGATSDPVARHLVEGVVRLSTYADPVSHRGLSAGAAVRQVVRGIGAGVLYLNGGWQQMVDALVARAVRSGVRFGYGDPVATVDVDDTGLVVRTASTDVTARAVVVSAGGPSTAEHLTGATGLSGAVGPPARVSVLDLSLDRPPGHRFLLGLDEPVYGSVHGPPARLGPDGTAVLSLARYLGTDEQPDPDESRAALEAVATAMGVDPSMRLGERYLHAMTVTHGLPLADRGGSAGRPAVDATGLEGVFLAGDWVGPTGLLADAAVASAEEAADAALAATR